MSSKKKKAMLVDSHPYYRPYCLDPSDDWGICYARYMADPTRIVQHGGRTYYKIFECLPFSILDKRGVYRTQGVLVWMTVEMPRATGGVLLDENGNRFDSQIETVYLRPKGLLNYFEVIYPMYLTGDTNHLGEYLTPK